MQTREYVIDSATGCWLWQRSLRSGYGRAWRDGRLVSAHRWFWEQRNGPVPEGLELDHTCHTESPCVGGKTCRHRRCVNPDHLEPVTRLVNVRRGRRRKLTVEQVAEIKAQHRCGIQDLADRYGVAYATINSIRNGQTWKEVQPDGRLMQPQRLASVAPRWRRVAPLTEKEVIEIKSAPRYHGIGRELAHRYGVADSVISAIRTGRTWAGMEGRVV